MKNKGSRKRNLEARKIGQGRGKKARKTKVRANKTESSRTDIKTIKSRTLFNAKRESEAKKKKKKIQATNEADSRPDVSREIFLQCKKRQKTRGENKIN